MMVSWALKRGAVDQGQAEMSMEDKILKNYQGKSALLTLLVVGFVTLFSVGCGDSDQFVHTGNVAAPGQSGNLVFNFTQAAAQTLDEVPAGTTSLRFDFFSSTTPSEGTFLFTETRAYAEQIVFNDVPTSVVFVAVTAFGANNQPLAVLTGDVAVVIGADTPVDLVFNSNPTFNSLTLTPAPAIVLSPESSTQQVSVSANFTAGIVLGQTTPEYDVTIPNSDVTFNIVEHPSNLPSAVGITANITTDGLLTGTYFGQNATLTGTWTAFGTERTSNAVLIRTCDLRAMYRNTYSPNIVLYTGGGPTFYDQGYSVFFRDSNRISSNVTSEARYSLETPATGVSVDQTTGRIDAAGDTTGTHTLVIEWTDERPQAEDGTGGTNTSFRTTTLTFELHNVI
jgi:hypothetical protein